MSDTEPKNTSQSDTSQETSQEQTQNPVQEQTAKPPIEQPEVMNFSMFGNPKPDNKTEQKQ